MNTSYPTGQCLLKLFNVSQAKFRLSVSLFPRPGSARESYRPIAGFLKSSRLIKVAGDLKKEVECMEWYY